MARAKWKKYRRLSPKILKIIGEVDRPLTTNEVRLRMWKKYNVLLSWTTMHKFLNEMIDQDIRGYVYRQNKNKITVWELA